MMIQNANLLLQELSELEEKILYLEKQVKMNNLDIDTEALLKQVLNSYKNRELSSN